MLQEERRRLATMMLLTALIVGGLTYAITQAYDNRSKSAREDQLQTEVDDLKNQLNAAPAPVTITTPTATADWQTYSNTANGFSIKYPKDWKVTTGVNGTEAVITNYDYNGQNTALQSGQTRRTITVIPNVSSMPPTDIYTTLTSPGERIAQVEALKTANASAMVFKVESGGATFYRALIPADNRMIVITGQGSSDNLNEMIETVRLTG